MTDLGQRLRADAAHDDGEPPSFELALDAAAARRTRTPWLAAAASVVLVAAVATSVAVWHSGDDSRNAATGVSVPGLPPTQGDKILQRLNDAGYQGVVLVPGNPRALDVIVQYSTQKGACSLFRPEVTIIDQSSSIRLTTSGYSYLPKPNKSGYTGFSCFGSGTRTVRVQLDAPVGKRLVRGQSGTSLTAPADPTDFPVPRHIPEGYVAADSQRIDAAKGNVVAVRSYVRRSARLEFQFGPADQVQASGVKIGKTEVGGHHADLTKSDTDRCIRWLPRPGYAYAVCSEASGSPLPGEELIQVARSIP